MTRGDGRRHGDHGLDGDSSRDRRGHQRGMFLMRHLANEVIADEA
jgi:hypothetical protein